ncbi:hypothetical protein D3C87_809320 [compost metagenome]
MNRIFLLLLGSCLVSCASTQSVSPVFGGSNAEVMLETNHMKTKNFRLPIENKAIALLNQLFNSDSSNTNMVLIINNDSDCDFTMNIVGDTNHSIPVGSKKTESIVLPQGDYEMSSNVCSSQYLSRKKLMENTQVVIRHSVINTTSTVPFKLADNNSSGNNITQ